MAKKSIKSSKSAAQRLLGEAITVHGAAGSTASPSGGLPNVDTSAARIPLLYLDPLFDQILIVFPQDNIRELNRRLRHYYKYDPYVRSIIDFHTETPISDFELRCPRYPKAEKYYNKFKDDKNLLNVCTNALRDYWLLGESFHYGNWDEDKQEYLEFVQLPPEEVEVKSMYISTRRTYVLRPNREVIKMLRSTQPADRMLVDMIKTTNPRQIKNLLRNKPFILNSSRLIVMQREMAGYSNRGVPPMLAVVKDLMFQDFLNLFRTVFIQRHSYPLKIFKIGSEAKGFIPNRRMLNDFRLQIINAINDPDYNIITHPFVTLEAFTGHDKILPLIPYYDLVKQRVFAGLFASEATVSGEKTPYAAGVTFMRGLMNRYLTVRNNLESELKRKVFEPLARKHGFFDKDGDPVIPRFFWHKANLLSSQAIQQMVMSLREKGEIPFRFVSEMFGFDLEDIAHQFKREEGTRTDSLFRKARDEVVMKNKSIRDAFLAGADLDEAIKAKLKKELKTGKVEEEEEEKPGVKAKPPTPGKAVPPSVTPAKPETGETPTRPGEMKEGAPEPAVPPAPKSEGTASLPGERKPKPGETPEAGEGA